MDAQVGLPVILLLANTNVSDSGPVGPLYLTLVLVWTHLWSCWWWCVVADSVEFLTAARLT